MTCIRSEIIGHGHYQPAKVLTNDDMAKIVETSDEWITERTGIKSRHIAAEDEFTSDLSFKAAEMALKTAGISAEEIDLIVLGTVTPDNTFPSVATRIAAKLGCRYGIPAFDLSAACSGFVYSLTMADNMLRLGQAKTALVIGAETLSRVTDWSDRNTCILFGDGAGAVVIRAVEGKGDITDHGVLGTKIFSDGTQYDNLYCTGGVSSTKTAGVTFMNGKEVFKNAIGCLTQAAEIVAQEAGIKVTDIDWLLPHQANIRIIEGVGKKLELPESKVIVTIDHQANTSAASIPLALSECLTSGKIKKGDLVLFNSMGAGFTWGGALVRI